ncbi:MAG TPA: arylsulfatase [Phycisphaerales bacterium]|nr:arylsulfatase [Phycisphaerales bacterium]
MRHEKPNLVFVFSDQQRWDTCGCYGQKLDVTPNLDRMAAGGVRFERAFTCQPVCGPARACLQTGKYPTEIGCYRNDIALPLEEKTLAHHLRAAGYEAGYIGKWHLASTGKEQNYRTRPVPPERRGGYDFWLAADVLEFTSHSYDGHMFDGNGQKVVFPEGRYRPDCLGDYAVEYLRTRKGDRPFFLFLSFIEPHHQNDHNRYEGPNGSKERFADYETPGDLIDTAGDWRENYPDYLGCCHAVDANLGRILDELDRLGIADNTVVLYTSDHGSHFRTRNAEYKRSCHDGCLRIPLVVRGPGFAGGRVAREMVSLVDLPPTVLAAGGVTPPPTMRGRAVQGLLDGSAGDWRNEIFAQISESQVGRALRTERWKYSVRSPDLKGGDAPAAERYADDFLYDLDADPHERTNLLGRPEYRSVADELRARLIERIVQAGEKRPAIQSAW